jgi:LmbE family N-acetylglucosaminyl deacetylase
MNKTILAISAHPDDIEFGCGGTMFKFKEKGFDMYLIVATNGENGFKIAHKPQKERIKIRYNEQKKAARMLDIKKIFFLHYRDGYLRNDGRLRDRIAKIIKQVKPEIIISFDPSYKAFDNINLNHRDHRAIAEASFDAVFAARNRYMLPGEPHYVKQFYFYITDKPNHFENITGYIDKKIALAAQHRSQYFDKDMMARWIKTHLSSYTKKYKYNEQFRIVNIIPPLKGIKG